MTPGTASADIKAFLFDLGGVLVRVDSSHSFSQLARALGKPEGDVRQAMTPQLMQAYEKGIITSREFYDSLQNNCDAERHLSREDFRRFWQDVLFPVEEMLMFLDRVRQHFPIWYLSNTNDYHYEVLMEKFEWMKWCEGGIYSFQEGTMKPESRIYEITLKRIPHPAENILFLDDLPANVEGARRAGIQSVLFRDLPGLCQELKSRFPKLGALLCD